jgi:hypothetical protein
MFKNASRAKKEAVPSPGRELRGQKQRETRGARYAAVSFPFDRERYDGGRLNFHATGLSKFGFSIVYSVLEDVRGRWAWPWGSSVKKNYDFISVMLTKVDGYACYSLIGENGVWRLDAQH